MIKFYLILGILTFIIMKKDSLKDEGFGCILFVLFFTIIAWLPMLLVGIADDLEEIKNKKE